MQTQDLLDFHLCLTTEQQARLIITDSHFNLSLIFAGKARGLPLNWSTIRGSTRVGLLKYIIIYSRKTFYDTGPLFSYSDKLHLLLIPLKLIMINVLIANLKHNLQHHIRRFWVRGSSENVKFHVWQTHCSQKWVCLTLSLIFQYKKWFYQNFGIFLYLQIYFWGWVHCTAAPAQSPGRWVGNRCW